MRAHLVCSRSVTYNLIPLIHIIPCPFDNQYVTTYDDFPNNAEYRGYNSCKPTYGGANHRKYDNHHHYNYSDGHYESHDRSENTKDAADFLGQMVELKSQFTEMKSQQQILLESMKCIQNLWSNQIKQNVQHSYQMDNQFLTYNV